MAVKKSLCRIVVLGEDVTVTDVALALEHTGLSVTHTLDPCVFVVNRALKPPHNVVPFERPMFHRRQAD